MMDTKNIIQNALALTPAERLYIIEMLSQSLNEPDKEVDKQWREEVENRYDEYQKGKIKTISFDEVTKKWKSNS